MPMQRAKYPAYWPKLSAHIRFVRAENRCEWCGVANGALIVRSSVNPARYMEYDAGADCWRIDGNPVRLSEIPSEFSAPAIKVVLTVAHWPDPDTMNCRFSNLHALCQKCHNAADAPMRAKHAKQTRQAKHEAKLKSAGQLSFLDDVDATQVSCGKSDNSSGGCQGD